MKFKFTTAVVLLFVISALSACVPASTETEKEALAPSYSDAVSLYQGIQLLSDRLVASAGQRQIGMVAVADFVGPSDRITPLGRHISDKLNVKLFSSGIFKDFMERKQLKQVLQSMKHENTGYFDQSTVTKLGKMVGVESMVIGTIKDLGSALDVTAKIIESETGKLQGTADILIIKDSAVIGIMGQQNLATLTVAVEPAVSGKIVACDREGYLDNGMAIFSGIPYGECQVIVQPRGHESVRRSVSISSPSESVTIPLDITKHEVSFQINPPNATLTVDGKQIKLNDQGFAKVADLEAKEYSYVVGAEGHQNIIGTFNPLDKQLIPFDLETKDPYFATKNKFFKKVQEQKNNQDYRVDVWTNKSSYRVGDEIEFNFKAERDCYINLVDINSMGEISLLFPNKFHQDNWVKGGVTYKIPDPTRYGFKLRAQPPIGTDRLYAIASAAPLDIFPKDFSETAFVSLSRGTKTRGVGIEGVGKRLDQAMLKSASETVISIY